MGRDTDENHGRQSNTSDRTTAVATSTEVEARLSGAGPESEPSNPSQGGLAMISTAINDHLSLFRAGTATMMVGSALAISVLLYRRGLHGFVSVNQVPASYFHRRKRLRVRIAKVTATGPAAPYGEPKGSYGGAIVNGEKKLSAPLQGSDVFLHAEHITLPRRLLRLPPRSLLPSAGGSDAATFTMRLCGVSAEAQGLSFARKELVGPSVGCYCDAELLFREQMPEALPSASFVGGSGVGASMPVAVCHIHRRRGVLWRDVFQAPLDPKAGFGERLISDGLATLREEQWWTTDSNPNSAAAGAAPTATKSTRASMGTTRTRQQSIDDAVFTTGDEDDSQKRLHAPNGFHEDLERLAASAEDAQRERRGIWGLQQHEAAVSLGAAGAAKRGGGSAMKGLRDRAAGVVRAVKGLFGRWR